MELLGFDNNRGKNFSLGNIFRIKLTRPKKKGRISNKDKELYGKIHILEVPLGTRNEDILQALQKEADKLNLPIKFT